MTEFHDRFIEPKPVCGNCDYHAPTQTGQQCCNTRSPHYCQHRFEDDACNRFFPCSKRWPDADHD